MSMVENILELQNTFKKFQTTKEYDEMEVRII